MIFVCALIPISCVAVSLSFGGMSAPISLILPLLLLPLSSKAKSVKRAHFLLATVAVFSALFRFASLFMRSREALGDFRGVVFVAVCFVVAVITARDSDRAFYSAVPIFFITVFIAIYVTFVSIGRPIEDAFNEPSTLEIIASVVCAVGSCAAFSYFSQSLVKQRFRYAVAGVLIGSAFLLFPSAKAELGFVCVPLSIVMSAIELNVFDEVILRKKRE